MLVCSVSQLARRTVIAAGLTETTAALDSPGAGNVVFATLVDDPASVGEIVDAYLGAIMLEAATATETATAALAGSFSAATWDPATVTNVTLSGSNLVATNTSTSGYDQGAHVAGTAGKTTGKYYFEITITTYLGGDQFTTGIGTPTSAYTGMGTTGTVGSVCFVHNGNSYADSVGRGGTIGPQVTGDVVCTAVDLDNRKIWWRKGAAGNWNGNPSADPVANAFGIMIPATVAMVPFVTFGHWAALSTGNKYTANFGATAFVGAVPSGYTAGWSA